VIDGSVRIKLFLLYEIWPSQSDEASSTDVENTIS